MLSLLKQLLAPGIVGGNIHWIVTLFPTSFYLPLLPSEGSVQTARVDFLLLKRNLTILPAQLEGKVFLSYFFNLTCAAKPIIKTTILPQVHN